MSGEDYYCLDGLTNNDTGYPPADTCTAHVKKNTARKHGTYVMQRSLHCAMCSNSLVSAGFWHVASAKLWTRALIRGLPLIELRFRDHDSMLYIIIEHHTVAGPECSSSMTDLKTLLSCHHTKRMVTCSLNSGALRYTPHLQRLQMYITIWLW